MINLLATSITTSISNDKPMQIKYLNPIRTTVQMEFYLQKFLFLAVNRANKEVCLRISSLPINKMTQIL
jgi:hypothetical protein